MFIRKYVEKNGSFCLVGWINTNHIVSIDIRKAYDDKENEMTCVMLSNNEVCLISNEDKEKLLTK